jgi:hypothetical protein
MNTDEIERFLDRNSAAEGECVQIRFKTREAIYGLFIKDADYAYLKAKNFWRIVPQSKLEAYKTSGDMGLVRIFNGAEFLKLTTYRESFVR